MTTTFARARLGAAALLAALASAGPAAATLITISPCDQVCTITTTPPNPVQPDPDDGILLAWNERQNVTLTSDLRVDRVFDPAAPFVEAITGGFLIKAGTVVSSHYLQWDPLPTADLAGRTVNATIALDSQVFAFITSDGTLADSDAVLGLPGLDYNTFGLRGLEASDTTSFDGTDTTIRWQASTPGDWARLITAFSPTAASAPVPVPAALPLLAGGLAALAAAARRRRRG